jgi:hypothetical protein
LKMLGIVKTTMMMTTRSLMTGLLVLVESETWAFGQDASFYCV